MAENSGDLSGKVALVTGGSRGIGKAIAMELAGRGADIAFNYFRNHAAAREVEEAVAGLGVRCLRARAHLGDSDAIDGLFEKVASEFGRLDILVNNAASGVMRSASELEERHWDWTLDINARAPWKCAVAAANLMTDGGTIVNLTSPGSTSVLPDYFVVGISKAALESLTRYLAIEFAPRGIAVNAVSAGFIRTDAVDAFPEGSPAYEMAQRVTPAGRVVTAEDVAKVVAFLCGEDARMIRGQILLVDGGEMLVRR
ncbi:MAG: SDR family oxidoreductase [Chloroflexi bacterium]|nr:SDR family oxidoreductase [Chloroflexota bacterium]